MEMRRNAKKEEKENNSRSTKFFFFVVHDNLDGLFFRQDILNGIFGVLAGPPVTGNDVLPRPSAQP